MQWLNWTEQNGAFTDIKDTGASEQVAEIKAK